MEDRHADLQARIDAARQRLAEENKNEWAEIGNMLEGLSEELEKMEEPEEEAKRSLYERIEHGLATIHARLEGKTE